MIRFNMTKKELAQLLGISGSMVTRLKKRGMPVDSLERAQRWRKRHLESGRMKGTRFNPDEVRSEKPNQMPPVANPTDTVARAVAMLHIASIANEAGQSIDFMVPALRAALQSVPKHARAKVEPLPMKVMDILVADVFALCVEPDLPHSDRDASPMSDDEAKKMGAFWYEVAAGEWRAT
jgi:hypothetical protein